ncbi:MAG: hypothetical protein ACODAQ_12225, partial [Phycisphaeraceae bacterium]
PELDGAVAISKSSALLNVSKGELVPYTITVNNLFGAPLSGIGIVDRIPPGFKYMAGSARLDGEPLEPRTDGRKLVWDGLELAFDSTRELQLLLVVGAGVSEGEYVNRAQVFSSLTGENYSGEAAATVRVVPDPTFDCTDIIGKIFDDRNLNGYQDAGEPGLAGGRVVTARGLIATSDEHGRFHITCAQVPDEDRGSNFILKLDDRSLPSGYRVTTENPRVQRATRGKMLRFNFGAAIHRVVSIDLADGVFEPDSTRLRLQWTPKLDRLGWYLLDLTVQDTGDDGSAARPVARSFGALLWMPRYGRLPHDDRTRFALRAEDVSDEQWTILPQIMQRMGVERAVVSAWRRDTTTRDLEQRVDALERLLHELDAMNGRLTLSLHPVPEELGEHDAVSTRRPIETLAAPVEAWRPYLLPILMRHSQRVREWQLGAPAGAVGLFDRRLPQRLDHIHRHLREMAPRPRLIVPWRLNHARRSDLDASPTPERLTMSLDVPPAIAPEQIPAYLEPWREAPHDYRLSLRTQPADQLAHRRRVTDLALRMVHSWRAEPNVLQIPRPWTEAAESRPAVLPDPLLGVFANVAHQLAGRRIVGELAIGEGLACYILDGPAGGALVAWNVRAPADEARIEMYLGEAPVVRDAWGNARDVPLDAGVHRVRIGRTPVFITGIDPELARFRGSFRVEPALIESRQVPHNRTITLTNPWPRTISGELLFRGPEGWRHEPTQHTFSIAAGASMKLPVRLRFPIAEVAGPKTLRARFKFTAERAYDIEMATPMELGLPGIGFDATVAMEDGEAPGTRDAVIACVITNRGERNTALYVFANLVGHARQERLISRLEPGQSVVRRFRFRDVADEVREHPIRTGVRETDGPAILNKRLSPTELP